MLLPGVLLLFYTSFKKSKNRKKLNTRRVYSSNLYNNFGKALAKDGTLKGRFKTEGVSREGY